MAISARPPVLAGRHRVSTADAGLRLATSVQRPPPGRKPPGAAAFTSPRRAASTSAADPRPRAAATNNATTGSARPSAPASSTAVFLRAVRLMPRSRSLTDRGLRPAASASSSALPESRAARFCYSCQYLPPCLGQAPAWKRQHPFGVLNTVG